MHLIKVNAINSTNSFARELYREKPHLPLTCIVAKKQLQGRGQRGTVWDAEEGKNLTFSVFLPKPQFPPSHQFLLSAAVAVSLVNSLKNFDLPNVKVKWPNDILSANKKIAGILIENILSEGKVAGSIIGVGLNVNQENFVNLPQAGSMKTLAKQEYDPGLVLDTILKDMEKAFQDLSEEKTNDILTSYQDLLFRRNIPSTFELPRGDLFTGMITGVTPQGKLLVKDEEELKEFDLKEIRLCY
ncbi:biotin--[acetyl-CoA-carboxylase] ligase [Salinimicrobium xinjiangense]|uniref:biotin--[acetyl-CoA-carboxylase] ligase n=1 Tax=Salinimicrobium xinjiangense TaxID=438596 RepID=UPI0003F4B1F4|nr:biotin--[acetyl-CoA-carboxylase] ligase [Salinimicrobium xinjiangense]